MNDPVISITAAFVIGLLGSVHCVGMCGGIMNALCFAMPKQRQSKTRISLTLVLYNLGRVFSYSLAGAMIGGIGMLLQGPDGMLGSGLRIFAGLMMIAMGLYLAGWWRGLVHLESFGNHVIWRHIQPVTNKLMPVTKAWQALLLGMLWGWLPCGLVYSTLTLAGAAAQWQQSALIMASFGLGTVPVMLLTGVFAVQFKAWIQKAAVRNTAALLIIAFGIWTISPPLLHVAGGHNHSQENNNTQHNMEHHH
ncbi:MAG: sulfite exporter TauE/SafE family protein [Gammaproteobacteria bacterium]|nr:sulfite exporter TauE/SafE family protein [Gammaproteobacteria bacterium]